MGLSRRWVRASATGVCVLITTIVLCSALAPSAGAKVIYDRFIHKKFGIFPSTLALSGLPSSGPGRIGALGTATCDPTIDPSCASLMTNTGPGPVQHSEQDYLVFWGPSGSFPANYVTGMQSFLSGLAAQDYSTGHTTGPTGNPLSVLQQYYDSSGPGGATRFIPLAIQNAGTIMDTDPYPNGGHSCTDSSQGYNPTDCVTGDDIQSELESYIAAHGDPTGVGVEYFVLTPPSVGSCDDSTSTSCFASQYCAWHTFDPGDGNFTYADIPYATNVSGCDQGANLNNDGTDAVVTGFSHELAETMTDPEINAWQGSGGGSDEIGDKCAYQYVVGGLAGDTTGLPAPSGTPYDITLGGRNYLLQMEFNNSANGGTGGCTQWDTYTQPTASISVPGSVAPGTPASFSLTSISAPAGIAYVTWDFGDGSATQTSIGTAAIDHTYSASGNDTVTAILTDNQGNEFKTTAGVPVGGGGGKASPTLSVSAPSSGTAGTGIPASSIGATVSGGNSPSGTITYTVFGPQSSPPSDCSSGGSAAGTASASGDGTYHPSSDFTPSSAGGYWWYASYAGDSGNNPATSTCGVGMAETIVTSAPVASLLATVLPKHPAPRGAYTVKVSGVALSGGGLGSGHNQSDVELYNGFGSCAATWAGEAARAALGKAVDIGHWLVGAGSFSFTQHRTATPTPFSTVRFCGYVSRTRSLTDAHGSAFYTTT